MNVTTVLTDMDQVICATQDIHGQLESEILAQYGKTVTPAEIARDFAGMGTDNVFRHYLGEQHVAKALREKESRLCRLEPSLIKEIPGACDFFKEVSRYYVVGLASGSSVDFINKVLSSLGIQEGVFATRASGEEVENNKPAPDVFELALKRMYRTPKETVIIEDGLSGIQAAKTIGAVAVGITTSYSREQLREAGADFVVDTFDELRDLLLGKNE